jgi:hypothetical protein
MFVLGGAVLARRWGGVAILVFNTIIFSSLIEKHADLLWVLEKKGK